MKNFHNEICCFIHLCPCKSSKCRAAILFSIKNMNIEGEYFISISITRLIATTILRIQIVSTSLLYSKAYIFSFQEHLTVCTIGTFVKASLFKFFRLIITAPKHESPQPIEYGKHPLSFLSTWEAAAVLWTFSKLSPNHTNSS